MNSKELEQQRRFVEAQMRWASLYGGDQELLGLLRIKSERLSSMIEQRPCVDGLLALQRLVRRIATTSGRSQ
jgi:hypothetical protein